MKRIICSSALLSLLLTGVVRAESKSFDVTVAAGAHDRTNDPVTVPLALLSFLSLAGPRVVTDGMKGALPAFPASALAFSSSIVTGWR